MIQRANHFDAIIVGSGFGGALAAWPLVRAGMRVLMLERGSWVARGPDNWDPRAVGLVGPYYSKESAYAVDAGARRYEAGSWHCVGGQSVFYGGASLRYRVADFEHTPEIAGNSGAEWPLRYDDMAPFYARVERLLGVAGEAGFDPCEPPRNTPYVQRPTPLSDSARRIGDAARGLGLKPFRLPLAISYDPRDEDAGACTGCGTCDGYACAVGAKNDVATGIIPDLLQRGLKLKANTVVVRLIRDGDRIVSVHCVDRTTGVFTHYSADVIILAAGTLATPHLLLASNLERVNPASETVGRYLLRHRNAVVIGVFRKPPNAMGLFDKQLAFHDFYFGHPDGGAPSGKLGGIQQLTPPVDLVRAYLPAPLRFPAGIVVARSSGLLVLAEDQPQFTNRVVIEPRAVGRFGLPRLHIHHRYSERDEAAAAVLIREARRILKAAGALVTLIKPIETFSHAVGTVRMGIDERTSPLDGDGRYRGLANLYVTDGSALPTSAAVNPSLTIAANALRVGTRIAHAAAAPRHTRALPLLPTSAGV
jgi:choline dehydrogenase-like flavoprotein